MIKENREEDMRQRGGINPPYAGYEHKGTERGYISDEAGYV